MANQGSALPTRIPPQSVPLTQTNADGQQITETNWYLFLYNLGANVLSPGATMLPPSVNIALAEADVAEIDAERAYNQALAAAQQPQAEVEGYATARELANALELASDQLADPAATLRGLVNALVLADGMSTDPIPTAQPAATITVGASPFTYTAPFAGSVLVVGGIVSAIALIRQGTSTATGMISGMFALARADQLQITYTGAPTVTYFPS